MNQKEEQVKMAFDNLDQIYDGAVKVAKEFGSKTVSPKLLLETIGLLKLKADKSNVIIHDYIKKQNKMLDNLYVSLAVHVKSKGYTNIPFATFKSAIDICKNGIEAGSK